MFYCRRVAAIAAAECRRAPDWGSSGEIFHVDGSFNPTGRGGDTESCRSAAGVMQNALATPQVSEFSAEILGTCGQISAFDDIDGDVQGLLYPTWKIATQQIAKRSSNISQVRPSINSNVQLLLFYAQFVSERDTLTSKRTGTLTAWKVSIALGFSKLEKSNLKRRSRAAILTWFIYLRLPAAVLKGMMIDRRTIDICKILSAFACVAQRMLHRLKRLFDFGNTSKQADNNPGQHSPGPPAPRGALPPVSPRTECRSTGLQAGCEDCSAVPLIPITAEKRKLKGDREEVDWSTGGRITVYFAKKSRGLCLDPTRENDASAPKEPPAKRGKKSKGRTANQQSGSHRRSQHLPGSA
ncbi:hypothetical protein DFH09DRAFT_1075807 [Mycena vulgaris]|nr:hypothetical protein DFH09DRAFT_1075807 [Mycena vulgaris]